MHYNFGTIIVLEHFRNIRVSDLMEVEQKEEGERRKEGEEERDTCTTMDRLMCNIVDEMEFDMNLA
jgi:hypothetical protein